MYQTDYVPRYVVQRVNKNLDRKSTATPLIFRPGKTRAPADLHFETRVLVVHWPHLMISQMAIQ